MTAVSEILVDSVEDVVTVPLHAVVTHDEKTYVVVRDESNRPHARHVELGQASDTKVSIQSGLSEGEFIAMNAQDLVEAMFSEHDPTVPAS